MIFITKSSLGLKTLTRQSTDVFNFRDSAQTHFCNKNLHSIIELCLWRTFYSSKTGLYFSYAKVSFVAGNLVVLDIKSYTQIRLYKEF